MRERSAGKAQVNIGHLTKAPACRVTGRRAFRRSTCGDFLHGHCASSPDRRTSSSRYPGSACALPFIRASPSHLRRPPHRGRTATAPPGTSLRGSPAGAAPCSAIRRLMMTPSIEQGMGAIRQEYETAKSKTRVCKVYQHCCGCDDVIAIHTVVIAGRAAWLVSRAQRSTKRISAKCCAADPGPRFLSLL